MDAKELLIKISEVLEKFGIKEALKKPEVIETIYNVMSKNGMKVDKGIFSLIVMGFASVPTEKLDIDALMKLGAGVLGAGGLAGAMGGQQQAQTQPNQSDAANPLAALGALGALAGALGGGAAQQQQTQPQAQPQTQQAQGPNLTDAVNAVAGIAKMLQQQK